MVVIVGVGVGVAAGGVVEGVGDGVAVIVGVHSNEMTTPINISFLVCAE